MREIGSFAGVPSFHPMGFSPKKQSGIAQMAHRFSANEQKPQCVFANVFRRKAKRLQNRSIAARRKGYISTAP